MWNGSVCDTPTCTGLAPLHAVLCTNVNENAPPQDTRRTLVGSCTDATKCEYTCDSTHVLSVGQCVPKPVDGACDPNTKGHIFDSLPSNRCTAGQFAWVDSTATDGEWNWTCDGTNGSTVNDPCSASKRLTATLSAKVDSGSWTQTSVTGNKDDGDKVALKWETDPNADSCRITGFGTASMRDTSSNKQLSDPSLPVDGQTTLYGVDNPIKGKYELQCSKGAQTVTSSVTVNAECNPTPWSAWGSCGPGVCDQDETGSRTRHRTNTNCSTSTETDNTCPLPKCKPDGFSEVAP